MIARLIYPSAPGEDDVEELELVRRSSSKTFGVMNKKSDNWGEAVDILLDWMDGREAPPRKEKEGED